ncbi:MAG: right-handed parallel beta-helix repeat-containing protein [Saprospiraceae bacterium]|nr:right-handed parallel beta-helix repeat-containing protein [Saprospiraceae bacterium]
MGNKNKVFCSQVIVLLAIWAVSIGLSCKETNERSKIEWKNIESGLQSALITAENDDTIRLKAGYFWFTRGLMMDGKDRIVIKGEGMDKTVLSFKGQTEGAEGLRISNCSNIQIIGLTVEDAKGDNIKVTETNGLYFSDVKVQWTEGAKETNGAYGFYPVLCKNIVIENCVAARASDAGIYVGQSDSVIIRNNTVYENVAGIESENSRFVDIYENHTYNNTGGILIFDLPGLTQTGRHTRVFHNKVVSNNHKNFAPKGNIVGMVPPGTGIMILASRDAEIFENEISNNRTSPLSVISYELVAAMGSDGNSESASGSGQGVKDNYKSDTTYNPYPENIYIHSNIFSNKHWFPTLKSDFGKLFLTRFFMKTPDIQFDGFENDTSEKGLRLCIQEENVRFANLNAPENLKNMNKDISVYNCQGEILSPAVVRSFYEKY